MDFLKIIITFILSFYIGKHEGFIDGAESVDFDRVQANIRLQQCIEIVSGR